MCVDLGDYNRYLNQIWYRTQILPYQHAGMVAILDFGKCYDFGKCEQLRIGQSYLRKSWWADASRPCGDETWPKVETGPFLRDLIMMMNKDVYIKQNVGNIIGALMSRRTRAVNLQIFSLSLQAYIMQNSPVRAILQLLICHTSLTNKL